MRSIYYLTKSMYEMYRLQELLDRVKPFYAFHTSKSMRTN